MAMKFNIGSVNAIKTDSEEPENNENKTKKRQDDDFKKKLITLGGIILGGLILLLLILYIISLFSHKSYTYDDLEGILKDAAVKYFADNKTKLPKRENQAVEITDAVLVDGEYMKSMAEYTKEGITCTGKVQVRMKSHNDYSYTPYLDCGDKYATKPFYQVVTKKVVNKGYGLYNENGTYIFKGEDVNNYVQLDNSLWRIVKVTSDNKMMLIRDDKLKLSTDWDNRYNSVVGYNAGINDYKASRIRTYLNDLYSDSSEEAILSSNDKNKLTKFNLCIGKRNLSSDVKDNSVECSDILANQKIGLLTVSDYINASLDASCKNTSDKSCQNYNYLVTSFAWWLTTASASSTENVFEVASDGVIGEDKAFKYVNIRPVVYLSDGALLKSGKGTLKKPYILK